MFRTRTILGAQMNKEEEESKLQRACDASLSCITDIVVMTVVFGICLHAKRLLFAAHLVSLHTQSQLILF